jgi:uncharacterized protein (TIGR03000 family)
MFRQLLTPVGLAVLAMAFAANPAEAQHVHQGNVGAGGMHATPHMAYARPATAHFSGNHVGVGNAHGTAHFAGNHFGVGNARVAPHAAAYTANRNYYRGQDYARYAANRNYYGGAHYPYYGRYGYGYRYPYYGNGFLLGLGLGSGYYGYWNPYYSGYGYPYSYSNTDYGYSYPDYGNTYPDYSGYDVIAPQTTVSGYPATEPAPNPVPVTSARLTIQLPADARLWIDGQPTNQTGAVRTFETPANLNPGRTYNYHLHAEWTENGQVVARDRDLSFQAGNQAVVNMTVP